LAFSALVIGWLQLILVTGAAMLPELGGRGSVETRGRVRCGSNLRQIGLGLLLYANANHGRLPPSLDLLLADPSADISADVLICPSTIDIPATGPTTQFVVADFRYSPRRCSYVYLPPNARLRALNPDQVVAYENPTNHAGQGMNVLFADGHVEWFQPHAATRLLSELAAGHNPPRPSAVQP
jgi:prepilin-type processing-associated H-X9-DG protein